MRKKIVFNATLMGRMRSNIQGKLTTPPLWYGALQRVPQPPAAADRVRSSAPITFPLEDRLRRLFLARNPQVQDEPLDLSRGPRKALRRSTAWRFVHEWICAMEDGGMSEDEAYDFVQAQRAAREESERSDVTELSLKWTQMTDAAIRESLNEASTARARLPSNWNASQAVFDTPQPGVSVLIRANASAEGGRMPSSAGANASEASQRAQPAARPGLAELDSEMRELAQYTDDVVSRKLDEIEQQLEALLAVEDGTASAAEHSADSEVLAYLEQDVPAPKGTATNEMTFKVKRSL